MPRIRILAIVLSVLAAMGCSHTERANLNQDAISQATHARTVLGLAYLNQHNQKKALANLSIAFQYSPNNLEVNLALAHYYATVTNNDRAESFYQTMYRQHPQDPTLLNNYAVFLCKTNQKDRATKLFRQAIEFSQSHQRVTAFVNHGLCAQKYLETERAAYNFNQALMIDNDNTLAYQGLIDIARQQGNEREQYRLLRRLKQVHVAALPPSYQKRLAELEEVYY